VCVVLCAVFRLIVVLFCVMSVNCVLCLTVVPLTPGENPLAVKINDNNNYNNIHSFQPRKIPGTLDSRCSVRISSRTPSSPGFPVVFLSPPRHIKGQYLHQSIRPRPFSIESFLIHHSFIVTLADVVQ
jgi:hypothetical protein